MWIGWTNCTECHWWWTPVNWSWWSSCKHAYYYG